MRVVGKLLLSSLLGKTVRVFTFIKRALYWMVSMSSDCKKSRRIGGLHVTVVSSADGTTKVPSLGSRTNVRHWVTVENLAGYPADIDCRGRIPAPHPVIKFNSANSPPDTATLWTDTYPGLPDSTTRTFNHITLLPALSGATGTEIIHLDLDVALPEPRRKHSGALHIVVSA